MEIKSKIITRTEEKGDKVTKRRRRSLIKIKLIGK